MRAQHSGFTLIELVIVIVILGILSAFALPRFADLGGDARIASLEGAAGAMKSATSITKSTCAVKNSCDASAASGESVNLEGATVNVEYGYPAASTTTGNTGGIAVAAQLTTDDYTITDNSGNVIVSIPDTDSGDCQVTYTAPTSSSSPDITVNDTGC